RPTPLRARLPNARRSRPDLGRWTDPTNPSGLKRPAGEQATESLFWPLQLAETGLFVGLAPILTCSLRGGRKREQHHVASLSSQQTTRRGASVEPICLRGERPLGSMADG